MCLAQQSVVGKLLHRKQQSQALSLPLPSSVPVFMSHHSLRRRPRHTCADSHILHATLPCSQPQSVLPERNIIIRAFTIVQTSAELKANPLKTLHSPFKGLWEAKLCLLILQSLLPPAGWLQAFQAQPLWPFSALPLAPFTYILQEVFLSPVFPCFSLSEESTNQMAVKLGSI